MKKVIPKKKNTFPPKDIEVNSSYTVGKNAVLGIAMKDSTTRMTGEYVDVNIGGVYSFLAKRDIHIGDLVVLDKDGLVNPYYV